MPNGRLLEHCIRDDETIDPELMADALGIKVDELAYLSWDACGLRDVFDLINVVRPWVNSATETWIWFRCERLAEFGDLTPDALVRNGRVAELREYLENAAPSMNVEIGVLAADKSHKNLSERVPSQRI